MAQNSGEKPGVSRFGWTSGDGHIAFQGGASPTALLTAAVTLFTLLFRLFWHILNPRRKR